MIKKIKETLDSIEPQLVGITVNPKMWASLQKLPKTEVKHENPLIGIPSWGSVRVVQKEGQIESYKAFYDEEEFKKAIKDG